MNFSINIHRSNATIELPVGIYKVYILGGWGVKVGNFTFDLINLKNGQIVKPKRRRFKVPDYKLNQRATKVFILDIGEYGNFAIKFQNQRDLEVRRSNLFVPKIFNKPLPNEVIEIFIGW